MDNRPPHPAADTQNEFEGYKGVTVRIPIRLHARAKLLLPGTKYRSFNHLVNVMIKIAVDRWIKDPQIMAQVRDRLSEGSSDEVWLTDTIARVTKMGEAAGYGGNFHGLDDDPFTCSECKKNLNDDERAECGERKDTFFFD